MAGQHRVGVEHAALVQIPHLVAVVDLQQVGREAAKEIAQVRHVAQQHAIGVVVAGGVHRLRQVDDDRTVFGKQDVEFGQVAMDHPGAQHADDFGGQAGMVPARLFGCEINVVQARGGVAVRVGHQFHQQHAIAEVVRLGHAHTGVGQFVQGIDLGALPSGFAGLPAELRSLGHGAGLPAVLDLAVFGVIDRLAKAALVSLLVDLGAARFIAAANHIHHRFLAAHELADDGIDQALFNEGLQSWRCFHACHCAPPQRATDSTQRPH